MRKSSLHPISSRTGPQSTWKGVDAAGKTIAGTETTSQVIHNADGLNMGLGKTFQVDGENIMAKIQVKPTRQDDGASSLKRRHFLHASPLRFRARGDVADPGQRRAGDWISDTISRWISEYQHEAGHYPKTLADLNKTLPKDVYSPTGEDYHYEVQRTRYILSSCGPDGIYGNDDDPRCGSLDATKRRAGDSGSLYPLPEEEEKPEAETERCWACVLRELLDQRKSHLGSDGRADRTTPECTCTTASRTARSSSTRPRWDVHVQGHPQGPFSLQSSLRPDIKTSRTIPRASRGGIPPFSLSEGEQRTGIVLKAKPACRISGKIEDENGEVPKDVDTLTVLAWFKRDDGNAYQSAAN